MIPRDGKWKEMQREKERGRGGRGRGEGKKEKAKYYCQTSSHSASSLPQWVLIMIIDMVITFIIHTATACIAHIWWIVLKVGFSQKWPIDFIIMCAGDAKDVRLYKISVYPLQRDKYIRQRVDVHLLRFLFLTFFSMVSVCPLSVLVLMFVVFAITIMPNIGVTITR